MKTILTIIILLIPAYSFAQDTDPLFERMQGIRKSGMDFFHVDGVEISCLPKKGTFTTKSIVKSYRELKVKEQELVSSDSLLGTRNYFVEKTIAREGRTGYIDHYFIDDGDRIIAVVFQSKHRVGRDFERQIVTRYLNNQMPTSLYQPAGMDSINFAGRYIQLGSFCQWMSVNNLQCPGNGQLSWSSFQTLEQAQQDLVDHFEFLKGSSKGRVLSDEMVEVLFEGQDAKARKVVYDFKGITSALVGMSGGKTLTIYMVAAPVRGRFVGAVMSHWNNDHVGRAQVPALTYSVMQLKGIE